MQTFWITTAVGEGRLCKFSFGLEMLKVHAPEVKRFRAWRRVLGGSVQSAVLRLMHVF